MLSNELRKDFPVLMNKRVIYLDSGATSQKPQQVIDAVKNYYENTNSNPHRGTYSLSIEATIAYDKVRQQVKDFINAPDVSQIIFTKNATEALNLIAYSYGLDTLYENDEIVVSIMEHHSNLVPWQYVAKSKRARLSFLYINESYEFDDYEIYRKITENTRIVCITYVSNVLGTINNVKKIIERAHEVGAVVVLDASQSISHMKLDVEELNVDFAVFSGHKMYAPMGVGVLFGRQYLLERMHPFLMGGDMIEYVYEQETTYAALPNKFEAGTQNVGAVVGLGAAIDYIEKVGYDNIRAIEKQLTYYAMEELGKLEFVEVYATPNDENHGPVISFNIKGVHPHDVASVLDLHGVCIRSGNHCAQPLLRTLNLDSTCRVSFGLYNTLEDVDALIDALEKAYETFEKYLQT